MKPYFDVQHFIENTESFNELRIVIKETANKYYIQCKIAIVANVQIFEFWATLPLLYDSFEDATWAKESILKHGNPFKLYPVDDKGNIIK